MGHSVRGRENEEESNVDSVAMSTIEEDSKELSLTDNGTDSEKQEFGKEAKDDVDVTGISSMTTGGSEEDSRAKKKPAKYVTREEIEASRPATRRRRKKIMRKIREQGREAADLYDPMAGLEIYGVHGKKKKSPESWGTEEIVEMDEEASGISGEAEKSSGNEISEETDKSENETELRDEKKSDEDEQTEETLAETQTDVVKYDTATETSGPEKQLPKRKKSGEKDQKTEKHREVGKTVKRDSEPQERRRRGEREKHKGSIRKDIRPRHETDSEEWFYAEQRKLWEQMCAKMAEYSHRSGCPEKSCQPSKNFPHDACTIPMYNPHLFRPPIQGHTCPRYFNVEPTYLLFGS